MNAIGKNATRITAGDWKPSRRTAAMKPSVAARLYAGAVDATPITMFETNAIAFFFSARPDRPEPRRPAGSTTRFPQRSLSLRFAFPERLAAILCRAGQSRKDVMAEAPAGFVHRGQGQASKGNGTARRT